MNPKFSIVPYDDTRKNSWQACLPHVRQQSFLFDRDFMDYHRDRFEDASLMVMNAKDEVVALLPACRNPHDEAEVVSHAGLTYGGLLLTPQVTAVWTGAILDACMARYAKAGFKRMAYNPVPYIYRAYPSEEDLYWLFRHGAQLQARAISSVIDLERPYAFSTLRKRKVKKAEHLTLETRGENLAEYWALLTTVLQERHGTTPVHRLDEIQLLMDRFPDHIRLCTARNTSNGELQAGSLLFVMPQVVHAQYIACSDEGCSQGALDWLFAEVLNRVGEDFPGRRYFDFGISTEAGGAVLNEGLIFQKEGFGGRGVCYDAYELELQ